MSEDMRWNMLSMLQPTIVVLFAARSIDEKNWPTLNFAIRTFQKNQRLSIGATIVASFCALVNQDQVVGTNGTSVCNTGDNFMKGL